MTLVVVLQLTLMGAGRAGGPVVGGSNVLLEAGGGSLLLEGAAGTVLLEA